MEAQTTIELLALLVAILLTIATRPAARTLVKAAAWLGITAIAIFAVYAYFRSWPSGPTDRTATAPPVVTPTAISPPSSPHALITPSLEPAFTVNLVWTLVIGLIIGVVAKLIMPGRDPGGCIITMLVGIAGSFVGTWLGRMFTGNENYTAHWIMSIFGAMLLLLLYRLISGRRS